MDTENKTIQEPIQQALFPKKVGLAIGGGFIRSAAAIGVIEVLEENNIPIHALSGCSAGSAVAGAYAAGNLKALKKRLLSPMRDYWNVIFEPTIPKQGLLKGQRTRKFWQEFVGEKTFDQMDIPLYVTATDLTNLKPIVLDQGMVSDAIQASVGVPGIFVPVKYKGKIITDGGNFNLIPSKVLYENDMDYVIAITVSVTPNPIIRSLSYLQKMFDSQIALLRVEKAMKKSNPNIGTLIWRASKLSASKISNLYHGSYRYDTLIKPDITGVKRWNVNKVDWLIHQGRSAAEGAVTKIKKDLQL